MLKRSSILPVVVILLSAFVFSGCAVGFYKGRPSDLNKIEELKDELSRLKEAKALLESRLKKEIDSNQIRVDVEDRGLVITFLAEVLFSSGKSKIRAEGEEILNKVAKVLEEEGITNDIGIEGHTDNEPIKHSGYKSNWELSTARATSVLHHLVDSCNVKPERLSATGYGEYRPIASNQTPEGREENRRVEIIIKTEEVVSTATHAGGTEEDAKYVK
ncbi:MAG: flagellar motor protein MotB [Candidatus Omnitrophota bacterium]